VMVQRTVCMRNDIRYLINSSKYFVNFLKCIFCVKLGRDRSEHSDFCDLN